MRAAKKGVPVTSGVSLLGKFERRGEWGVGQTPEVWGNGRKGLSSEVAQGDRVKKIPCKVSRFFEIIVGWIDSRIRLHCEFPAETCKGLFAGSILVCQSVFF